MNVFTAKLQWDDVHIDVHIKDMILMKVRGPNRKECDSLKRRERRELYVFRH